MGLNGKNIIKKAQRKSFPPDEVEKDAWRKSFPSDGRKTSKKTCDKNSVFSIWPDLGMIDNSKLSFFGKVPIAPVLNSVR